MDKFSWELAEGVPKPIKGEEATGLMEASPTNVIICIRNPKRFLYRIIELVIDT